MAGRNSEPSTSLQRLAIVDAVHATVEQVLLPLMRGSGCGVESVRVWLCNAADSKRVVLEALAHNAGAVRDVVVPHNAVDDTLLRQLASGSAAGCCQASIFTPSRSTRRTCRKCCGRSAR